MILAGVVFSVAVPNPSITRVVKTDVSSHCDLNSSLGHFKQSSTIFHGTPFLVGFVRKEKTKCLILELFNTPSAKVF